MKQQRQTEQEDSNVSAHNAPGNKDNGSPSGNSVTWKCAQCRF